MYTKRSSFDLYIQTYQGLGTEGDHAKILTQAYVTFLLISYSVIFPVRTSKTFKYIALFPCGLQFKDGVYGTAETSMIFYDLGGKEAEEKGLVALTGIEPVFRP